MTYNEKTKPIIKLIEQVACRHSVWQVFSDFLEMAAISISNAVDPVHREEREARYMEVTKQYSRQEIDLFPKMMGELIEALEQCAQEKNLKDVLGALFHDLELHNKYKGQFFTPQNICNAMEKMTINENDTTIKENGYISVCEPCVGAGAMLIGLANGMADTGFNYCKQMVATAIDVDIKCVHMAYLQLSLYGIPAVVIHGDSLLCKEWSRWYTPVYILDGWLFRQRCGITSNAGYKTDELLKCATNPMYALFRLAGNNSVKKPERKKQFFFMFEMGA